MLSDNIEVVKGQYAKKGDIITCASCNKDIYEFTKDIFYGDTREASQVMGINGFDSPQEGEHVDCPSCGVLLHL